MSKLNNLVIVGFKNCGKSTVSYLLSKRINFELISTDKLIELEYLEKEKERLTFRQIYEKKGGEYFKNLETEIIKKILLEKKQKCIIDCGGGVVTRKENRQLLKKIGKIIFLDIDRKINFERIIKNGIPAFFRWKDKPLESFRAYVKERLPLNSKLAEITINIKTETPEEIVKKIIEILEKTKI